MDESRDAEENIPALKNGSHGNDTLHLNTSLPLTSFPFAVTSNRDSGNELRLGHGSILLRSLISTSSIVSNTWAYFQGWTGAGAAHQLDGTLVLGGYDAAKPTENNITIRFSSDCRACRTGMVITITGIKMNLVNGSNLSIIGPLVATAGQACVLLGQFILSLRPDTWTSFVKVFRIIELDGLRPIRSAVRKKNIPLIFSCIKH